MWRSSNSNLTFELWTFSTDSKFDECFKRFVIECKFVEKALFHNWFHTVCTDSQRMQTNFFSQIQPITQSAVLNVQHNFPSRMCYIVLIWTIILLTLGNNIVKLLLNWPKPVHYIPTDKINASIICNSIWRILKVKNSHLMNEFWPASSHHHFLFPPSLAFSRFYDTWKTMLLISIKQPDHCSNWIQLLP